MARDYKRENKVTKSKPKNIKKRVERNAARRMLERLGLECAKKVLAKWMVI